MFQHLSLLQQRASCELFQCTHTRTRTHTHTTHTPKQQAAPPF